jgi:uncharacterized protein YjeT (DUF2065 family)
VTLNQNPPDDHARHDRLLVIRFLENDNELRPAELEQTRRLIASCAHCAALGRELQLISDSMINMALPSRPRDFRITPQQAAALESGGLRRFFRRPPRFGFELLRPLAGAAVAIGLLLVVAGSLPMAQSGAGAPAAANVTAAPSEGRESFGMQETPAEAGGTPAAVQYNDPSPAPDDTKMIPGGVYAPTSQNNPEATGIAQVVPTDGDGGVAQATNRSGTVIPPEDPNRVADSADQRPQPLSPLVLFGALLTVVGLMIVGLTYLARRMGRSPN